MVTGPVRTLLDWLDDLLQSGPPPTGPPSDDWSGEFRQAVDDVVDGGQPDRVSFVFDVLGDLAWLHLWPTLQGLTRPLGLDSPRSELEVIDEAAGDDPSLDQRVRSAVAAALIRKCAPNEPVQLDWLETLGRCLPTLSGRDQLSVLNYLGITGMDAEGLIAMATAAAIEAGTLPSLAPAALMEGPGLLPLPFGDWDKPGAMPDHLYIANRIHQEIGARYAGYHSGHLVLLGLRINTILERMAAQVTFPRRPLRSGGSRQPDIFDFTPAHPGQWPAWVYEIKPVTLATQAEVEGALYTALLEEAGFTVAIPGPIEAPGTTGRVPAPNGWAEYWPAGPGALIYQYRRAPEEEVRARDVERRRQTSDQTNRAALEDALASGAIVAGDAAPSTAATAATLAAIAVATAIPLVPPPP